MDLYIDTNVYLTFYHLTSEDLEELKKLHVLVKQKTINLYLPEQTKNEFFRNREVKIADAIDRFKENKLNNIFPQFCKDYREYADIREHIRGYEKSKNVLLEKLTKDILDNSLKADKVIDNLFKHAKFINLTDDLILKAKTRYDLGNPPGKKKSYGDAVIWETLLAKIETSNPIEFIFISDDSDYCSEFDNRLFNKFLETEWKEKKQSNIVYYKRLSEFFKEKYPQISIASDYEKDLLIARLASSSTFAETHIVLSELSKFEDFSSKQIDDIFNASISNSQIYWIARDSDVKDILYKIYSKQGQHLSEIITKEFERKFPKPEDPFADLPF